MHKPFCDAVLLIALFLGGSAPSALSQETPAERDARMAWWREAKFGMFIHWGVYAVPAGTYQGKQIGGIGEWILKNAEIPLTDYRAFAQQFNPKKYDPQLWARAAKDAGMRYVVITSKHHDGFALYDSDASDWDIAGATPYGKDLLSPLAEAVRGEGLRFGLYYSQAQDWVHPGGAKMGMEEGGGWDGAHRGDFDDYLTRIAVPQTQEILARFRPDVLWWDTPVWMTPERARPLAELLKSNPQIIVNNRLGGGFRGDTETPEQTIPATGYADRDWETCMTMNDTWGFKSYDHNWKSTEVLIRNLVDIVSKGGNYLLNVGPTAEGEVPPESLSRLAEIGAWMRTNGEAIYGTTASPCRKPSWGRITRKGDRLFLHVFDWPSDGRLAVPVRATPAQCRLLADPQREFEVSAGNDGLVVTLQGSAPDAICSVVELTLQDEPVEVPLLVSADTDGRLTLRADEAKLSGGVTVEQIGGIPNLGFWTSPADAVRWAYTAPKGAKYRVTAEVAGPQASELEISIGNETLSAEIEATGDYQTFQVQDLGEIYIAAADGAAVVVEPKAAHWSPINLRNFRFTPK